MVKSGKAGSVGEAVDRAVSVARRLDNRATLDHETARYFSGMTTGAAAEEAAIETALGAASQELGFDQP